MRKFFRRMHAKKLNWLFFCNLNIVFISLPSPVFSNGLSKKIACPTLINKKTAHAVLFDDEDKKVTGTLDLGSLDVDTDARDADYLMSKKTLRVIVFPPRMELETICSLSVCVRHKKVRSQCPSSSEYILSFGFDPGRLGPGKFEEKTNLNIIDSVNYHDAGDIGFSLEQPIKVTLSMPWIEVSGDAALKERLKDIFSANQVSLSIPLINKGNRPVRVLAWEQGLEKPQELSIERDECKNQLLGPSEICHLTLRNNGTKAPSGNFYQWLTETDRGDIIKLEIEKFSSNNSVGIGVRHY